MYDVHVIFRDGPGELARFGQLLGRNGVGLEGGGVFGTDAHFLVEDGEKARRVLLDAGFTVQALRKPVIRKLKQERPGELGEIAAALAARGVSILTQYSDHANHLILLTDDDKLAAELTTPRATNVKDELTLCYQRDAGKGDCRGGGCNGRSVAREDALCANGRACVDGH